MMRYAALAAADQQDYQLAEHCWTLAFRCQSYADDWNCCVHYGLALCHLKKYAEAEKVYLRVIQRLRIVWLLVKHWLGSQESDMRRDFCSRRNSLC